MRIRGNRNQSNPDAVPPVRVACNSSGEQFDPALGLYYLRARWMNPQTGRFMTRDPYEGDGALSRCKYKQFMNMSSAHHLYEYTHADPVNFLDPSGQNMVEKFPLLAGIAVGTNERQEVPWFVSGARLAIMKT